MYLEKDNEAKGISNTLFSKSLREQKNLNIYEGEANVMSFIEGNTNEIMRKDIGIATIGSK
eukprot:CAMPEP_0116900100 /NCGR_PEP_ID=MMETSP0467-20121206/8501_1 /TAXON_ID=283647 /ORGANISM="Mesodinium pulex, Strain SPMC105" /LENGTH=60 /DNA_ID=CAMNT_0004573247 /DNA_START=495 /DNA_END=677 /DNA_ORIENTATION=+